MKRKYQKTSGYYVYAHITPEKECYFGISQQQPYKRWKPSLYKGTALKTYIERFGWENIEHLVIQDNLTKEQALKLEDWFITNATRDGFCINKQRSGLIWASDINAYHKKRYSEHQEELKVYNKQYKKQYLSTTEGKIYNRVHNYNRNHTPIETPAEAKQKYLESGYIPSYIKNNDILVEKN